VLSVAPALPISVVTPWEGPPRVAHAPSPWDAQPARPFSLCKGQRMWLRMMLLLSGFGLLLNGCTVYPGSVAVTPPAVVVPAVTVDAPPPARYCPPGHAKKGWC
jgi:hypothetical protein